jgi:hypothetical protein
MLRLVVAGILYLVVIAIVLTAKPSLMFDEEGNWKEFGIGRNPRTHTWMPFWLFAIGAALLSYILTILLFAAFSVPTGLKESAVPAKNRGATAPAPQAIEEIVEVEEADFVRPSLRSRRLRGTPTELPDGYYMLNREATEALGGVPKYVYLGKTL